MDCQINNIEKKKLDDNYILVKTFIQKGKKKQLFNDFFLIDQTDEKPVTHFITRIDDKIYDNEENLYFSYSHPYIIIYTSKVKDDDNVISNVIALYNVSEKIKYFDTNINLINSFNHTIKEDNQKLFYDSTIAKRFINPYIKDIKIDILYINYVNFDMYTYLPYTGPLPWFKSYYEGLYRKERSKSNIHEVNGVFTKMMDTTADPYSDYYIRPSDIEYYSILEEKAEEEPSEQPKTKIIKVDFKK